ncbi:MAG TPA: hypothetical protein VFV81_06480 [Verrucomicrobiae bacterium]|nr:hypothetical protein [Verrucomicrobiae bacterium]
MQTQTENRVRRRRAASGHRRPQIANDPHHSGQGGKPTQTEWKQESDARRGSAENPE